MSERRPHLFSMRTQIKFQKTRMASLRFYGLLHSVG